MSCRSRYWHKAIFDAIDVLKRICENHDIDLASASLRWLRHYSGLTGKTVPKGAYFHDCLSAVVHQPTVCRARNFLEREDQTEARHERPQLQRSISDFMVGIRDNLQGGEVHDQRIALALVQCHLASISPEVKSSGRGGMFILSQL